MWECMKAKSRPLYRGWKLSWCPTPPPNAYARKDTCTTTSRVTSCCALSNSTWLKVQGLGFTLNDPHPDPMNWGRQPHKCKHPEYIVVLSLMVGRSASRMRGGGGRAGEGLNSGICKRRRGPNRGGMDDGEDRTGSQQLRSLEQQQGGSGRGQGGQGSGGHASRVMRRPKMGRVKLAALGGTVGAQGGRYAPAGDADLGVHSSFPSKELSFPWGDDETYEILAGRTRPVMGIGLGVGVVAKWGQERVEVR